MNNIHIIFGIKENEKKKVIFGAENKINKYRHN
jgi:hypothetical protein